jgi:hypothetical protein
LYFLFFFQAWIQLPQRRLERGSAKRVREEEEKGAKRQSRSLNGLLHITEAWINTRVVSCTIYEKREIKKEEECNSVTARIRDGRNSSNWIKLKVGFISDPWTQVAEHFDLIVEPFLSTCH